MLACVRLLVWLLGFVATWLRVTVALLVVSLLGFLALRASPYLVEIRWLPRWIGEAADQHGVLRNVPAFAVLFGVLAYCMNRRDGLTVFVVTAVLASFLELVQLWVPGRSSDWKDVLASWAGAGIGWGAWVAGRRWQAWRGR